MLPAAVGQMSQRQAMSRQAIPEDGEKGLEAAPSAQPGRPPVGGVPGNPLTAIKVPAPAAAANAAPAASQAPTGASGGPGTPPERPPTTDALAREHSEEPTQALSNLATKLADTGLTDLAPSQTLDVRQEVAAASSLVQPPPQPVAAKAPVNPFSSAFAYTERMNSAFTSGS